MQRMAPPPLRLLLSLALLGTAATAQDLGTQVREMIVRADKAPIERVWEIGRQNERPGREGGGAGPGDPHPGGPKPAPRAGWPPPPPCRRSPRAPEFGKEIFTTIVPVLRSKDVPTVKAGLSIAARDEFFSRRVQPDLRERRSGRWRWTT